MNDIVKAWEGAGSPHPYSTFREGYRAVLQSQDREDALTELLDSLEELLKTQEQNAWTSKHKYSLGERMNASMRYQKARQAVDHARRVEGEMNTHDIDRALVGIRPDNHPIAYRILTELRSRLETDRKRRGEPVAKVNDEGFIVETGLGLAPGTKLYATPQPAEPVKVPSDEKIEALAFEYCDETGAGGDCPRFIGTQSITRLIRALLSRYGQP